MLPVPILYRCGDELWVPLSGPWGAISYTHFLVLRQLAAKQFVPVTNGLNQLDFSYEESGAMKKVDQLLQIWKQTVRMSTGNLSRTVTPEYMVWRAKKVEDVVIPFGMEDVQFEEELPEMPSELEIAKKMFEEEKKKMRVESRRQQEETEKWKEHAEVQEDRLRKMSINYETSQKNFKMLNEDMVKLDRKFKYAGLRASLGLPQDKQEKMERELSTWKHQASAAQKKVTQLQATARTKDARHLKKIEELRAIARNKHESLEAMIRTLEQQLKQQKDRTDRFIAD